MNNRGKTFKLDFITINKFYTTKEIAKKVKRQLTKWEKRFANVIFDKGFISKIHKELLQLNRRKTNRQVA